MNVRGKIKRWVRMMSRFVGRLPLAGKIEIQHVFLKVVCSTDKTLHKNYKWTKGRLLGYIIRHIWHVFLGCVLVLYGIPWVWEKMFVYAYIFVNMLVSVNQLYILYSIRKYFKRRAKKKQTKEGTEWERYIAMDSFSVKDAMISFIFTAISYIVFIFIYLHAFEAPRVITWICLVSMTLYCVFKGFIDYQIGKGIELYLKNNE